MIPWIQVYSNLIKHPKTYALADELKITCKDASPNAVAAGMLISLWLWAAQNATDGDLSQCSIRAIAEASEYKKNPASFVTALKKTRWLDDNMKLHDWGEYAMLLMDIEQQQREKTKERVQRHRAKKKAAGNGKKTPECNAGCNVTDTPGNAPTIPNHTIPNLTIISGDDGGVSAGAREANAEELATIGLKLGEYPGVTHQIVEGIRTLGPTLFETYAPHSICTILDFKKIFQYVIRTDFTSGRLVIDSPAAGLLEYAFEMAWRAEKPGNWRYIDGIMGRCSARGILTAQMAREWDEDRPDLDDEAR